MTLGLLYRTIDHACILPSPISLTLAAQAPTIETSNVTFEEPPIIIGNGDIIPFEVPKKKKAKKKPKVVKPKPLRVELPSLEIAFYVEPFSAILTQRHIAKIPLADLFVLSSPLGIEAELKYPLDDWEIEAVMIALNL